MEKIFRIELEDGVVCNLPAKVLRSWITGEERFPNNEDWPEFESVLRAIMMDVYLRNSDTVSLEEFLPNPRRIKLDYLSDPKITATEVKNQTIDSKVLRAAKPEVPRGIPVANCNCDICRNGRCSEAETFDEERERFLRQRVERKREFERVLRAAREAKECHVRFCRNF